MHDGKLLNDAINLIGKGADLKVLVIGEVILDIYSYGSIDRISSGVSIPTVDIKEQRCCLGGAGNIAANISSFVKQVSVLSPVGDKRVYDLFSKYNIDESCLIEVKDWNLKKERIYVSDQQLMRLDHNPSLTRELSFDYDISEYDVVVIADYHLGYLTSEMISRIIESCNQENIPVVSTTRSTHWHAYRNIDHIVLNLDELESFCKTLEACELSLEKQLDLMVLELNCKSILLTCGKEGLIYYDGIKYHYSSIETVYPVNVSGAGDSVLALFTAVIREKLDFELLGIVLNLAGRLAVLHEETKVVSRIDLIHECYRYFVKMNIGNKIVSRSNIQELIEAWRVQGETIVFTNGCFDILHSGHIQLIQGAKAKGKRLILGVNSDDSIKRLKGEDRPINNQNDRMIILSSLEAIDSVVLFDEDTAINLIKLIKPDVYVKGNEYQNKTLPEAEFVDRIEFLDMYNGLSTTSIINKINKESNE